MEIKDKKRSSDVPNQPEKVRRNKLISHDNYTNLVDDTLGFEQQDVSNYDNSQRASYPEIGDAIYEWIDSFYARDMGAKETIRELLVLFSRMRSNLL